MKSVRLTALLVLLAVVWLPAGGRADIANAWHIPSGTQTGIPGTMRDQFVEISPTGSFTVYTGFFKNGGAGGNQTGGTVFYRKGTSGGWTSVALAFGADAGGNQFWK